MVIDIAQVVDMVGDIVGDIVGGIVGDIVGDIAQVGEIKLKLKFKWVKSIVIIDTSELEWGRNPQK